MIVVDASALLAIYFSEPERDLFAQRLRDADAALMSPINLWETLVRASAIDGDNGRQEIENLLANFDIEIAAIDADTARAAVDAFTRYGKRAPAKLNMGDCFAYALAKTRDAPLLYKGDDFAHTDIVAA